MSISGSMSFIIPVRKLPYSRLVRLRHFLLLCQFPYSSIEDTARLSKSIFKVVTNVPQWVNVASYTSQVTLFNSISYSLYTNSLTLRFKTLPDPPSPVKEGEIQSSIKQEAHSYSNDTLTDASAERKSLHKNKDQISPFRIHQ